MVFQLVHVQKIFDVHSKSYSSLCVTWKFSAFKADFEEIFVFNIVLGIKPRASSMLCFNIWATYISSPKLWDVYLAAV